MTKGYIMVELAKRNDRSAWNKGVTQYCFDLLENIDDNETPTEEALLNGAYNWNQYSDGGCALIYNEDIAKRLCTPSELKRTHGGELNPNRDEIWLDVQVRALKQAASRILSYAKMDEKFYAVQIGNEYDLDAGAWTYKEALKMANASAKNPDNDKLEIRVAVVNQRFREVEKVIVVRKGETE